MNLNFLPLMGHAEHRAVEGAEGGSPLPGIQRPCRKLEASPGGSQCADGLPAPSAQSLHPAPQEGTLKPPAFSLKLEASKPVA